MKNMDRRTLLRLGASAAAASWNPWLGAQALSPASARLSVDFSTESPLAADFTGLSYETAQLAHPAFFSSQNTKLVSLVRTLGPRGVLRIGGNTSDFAVWSVNPAQNPSPDTMAPVGPDRPGIPGMHTDKPYAIAPEAIDQLKTFLEATGWRLIYGINLPHNTPERAAAEAAYVIRKIGTALVAIQLGNEPDLYSKNGTRPSTYTYADYFAEWQKLKTAILATTPTAPIGGPDVAHLEWFQQFAAQASPICLTTSHYYPLGPPTDPAMSIDRLLRPAVKNRDQTQTAIAASRKAGVPYRMSEGNTCYRGGKEGVSDVFASALWGIDYMLSMAQLGSAGINFHGGGNGFYTPIANPNSEVYEARPLYYAMLMFREFSQQDLLQVQLAGADPALSAYASSGSGDAVHVAVINKSRTNDVTLDIAVPGVVGDIHSFTLCAPAIDSLASAVTFAGSTVDARGEWHPTQINVHQPADNNLTLTIRQASAMLLKMNVPPAKAQSSFSRTKALLAGVLFFAFCFGSPHLNAQAAASSDKPPAALPSNAIPAVTYSVVQGQTLVADLYLPKGKGPFPAIVFIHGGAWRSGTRDQLRGQAILMADSGFFGMAIEYRLAPRFHYPACADDAKSAVRWLRQNAAKYNIDPDKIAVVGSSAGAHLAALLGTESSPLPSGTSHRLPSDASVQAVVGFNGIYDLASMPPSDKNTVLLGGECDHLKDLCKDASPMQHVRPGVPPMLLLHGTADETAPYSQAVNFQDRLLENKDHVELFTAPDAPHTFWNSKKWRAPSFEAMRIFLIKAMQ